MARRVFMGRPVDERSQDVPGERAWLQPVPDPAQLGPAGRLDDRSVKLGVGVEQSEHVTGGAGGLHRAQQPLQVRQVVVGEASDRPPDRPGLEVRP